MGIALILLGLFAAGLVVDELELTLSNSKWWTSPFTPLGVGRSSFCGITGPRSPWVMRRRRSALTIETTSRWMARAPNRAIVEAAAPRDRSRTPTLSSPSGARALRVVIGPGERVLVRA